MIEVMFEETSCMLDADFQAIDMQNCSSDIRSSTFIQDTADDV